MTPRCPHCSSSSRNCCAWAEGAAYSDGPVRLDGILEVGLGGPTVARLLCDDLERWPLLVRSSRCTRKAQSTKVEWLVNATERCNLGHCHNATKAEFNYTQIFRTMATRTAMASRSYGGTAERDSLELLLDQIEASLRHGVRSQNGYVSCMAGAEALLGRYPRKTDKLQLVILRDLIRRTPFGTDGVEWLVELTLQATRGSE